MTLFEDHRSGVSDSTGSSSSSGPDPELDEAALIARCRDEIPDVTTGFRELVRIYHPYAVNVAMRLLNSREDAEEVAQDSLLQVFHKLHSFEGRSAFRTGLHIIVLNSARKRLSKVQTRLRAEKVLAENIDPPTPEEPPNDRIQLALQRLDEGQREVIVLRFFSGMKMDEMADTLGIGSSAVKMRLYRSMEAFKQAWEAVARTHE
jgi:RNA polymerase sigma-70 factor (ECF subfamily)